MARLSCALLLLVAAAPARAGDPAADRAAFDRAFADLSAQTKERLKGGLLFGGGLPKTFFEQYRPVDTPAGPSTNMVRVWAKLTAPADPKKQYVSLDGYTWKPMESFRVEVEVAIPMQVHLYNERPDRKREVVFPEDADRKTPGKYTFGTAGRHTIDFELETEASADPEPIYLLFIAEGSGSSPKPPKKDTKEELLAHRRTVDALLTSAIKDGKTYRGLEVAPAKTPSAEPKDVAFAGATIGEIKGDTAIVKVTLKKK